VVNAIDWLVTSFMTSMMTILSNKARPADQDQLILRGLKKSARSYLLYLLTSYVLAERAEYMEDTFASASSEFCAPGGSYFGYSVFPGVMLASSMRTPESLFSRPATTFTSFSALILLNHYKYGWACMSDLPGCGQ
jgi:hypothetical protein